MLTLTSTQKRLMAQLGINLSSEEQINTFFEGWEESSFECRANGIPTLSFDKYLEQKILWNDLIKNRG